MNMQMKTEPTRRQVETVRIDHPVMPVELALADGEVSILTGRTGSQTQMLMDDIGVILTALIEAGIGADELLDRLGSVDERDAPVTRGILAAIADTQQRDTQRCDTQGDQS